MKGYIGTIVMSGSCNLLNGSVSSRGLPTDSLGSS